MKQPLCATGGWDVAPTCRVCRHFDDSPAALEAALPGLASLSSAYAAVRAGDGLCTLHDRYLAGRSVCDSFAGSTSTRQS